MNWQLAILLQTVFIALSLISLRVLARDKRTASASFAIGAGAFVTQYAVMLPFVPLFGHIDSSVLQEYWWRFVLGGIAFSLFGVCVYKTMTFFDVAVANLVVSVNAIFAVIGAFLFLSEKLSTQQLVGAIILLFGVGYGLLATHATHKKAMRRKLLIGGMYAVIGGILFAFAAINEKSLLSNMTIGSYILYGTGIQALIGILLGVIFQPRKMPLLLYPHVLGWTAATGILRGLGAVCFIVAEVKSDNIGLVSVVANFRLMLVVLMGAWLLKERNHLKQKSFAAITAIAGITVMFWK
ncbi:MAG TPA: DMT family transporter [Candidatus Saccharimonadales bacterium]|nr:DMT family transporter [Candidatus Saccharimonadales bacterium]